MIVYCATNIVDGKKYIGLSVNSLKTRMIMHKHHAFSQKTKKHVFQRAILQHGWDSFRWEVLKECSSVEEMVKEESRFIQEFGTIAPNGYNLSSGGEVNIVHESTKEKLRKINTGKKHLESAKKKVSEAFKGRFVGEKNAMAKKVVCVETGVIFNTIKEAAESTGVDYSTISSCARGRQSCHTAGGYHWRFYGMEAPTQPVEKTYRKKIRTNTGLVFNSLNEAAKALKGSPSGISSALSGRRKKALGFRGEYVDEC